ncbi:IS1 family transposase [Microcoleus sp. Pol11C1]|uniref:IS1 family transposase n=1 Tax=Microcoleus sp. Pol1C5 TaxID=3055406 RepID=UPI002FCFFAFD
MKKAKGSLTLQVDEMWSIVKNNLKKQWLWIAFDRNTRKIVGLYIEERSKKSASMLWQSLPHVYRQCAVCYTDLWESR